MENWSLRRSCRLREVFATGGSSSTVLSFVHTMPENSYVIYLESPQSGSNILELHFYHNFIWKKKYVGMKIILHSWTWLPGIQIGFMRFLSLCKTKLPVSFTKQVHCFFHLLGYIIQRTIPWRERLPQYFDFCSCHSACISYFRLFDTEVRNGVFSIYIHVLLLWELLPFTESFLPFSFLLMKPVWTKELGNYN